MVNSLNQVYDFAKDGESFPTEMDVMKCRDYQCNLDIEGYTHVFTLTFLPCRKEWMKTFTRTFINLIVDGKEFWLFQSSIDYHGVIHSALGSGFSKGKASDASCYFLGKKLRMTYPGFAMPRYAIGYPNIRGHCFVISGILPLLHCHPFICTLFDYNIECERKKNAQNLVGGRHVREPIEVSYYWTNTFYKVYAEYRKRAIQGVLQLLNEDLVDYLKLPSDKKLYKPKPRVLKPDSDLNLDKTLIKGLVSSLVFYCDGEYFSSPGGDEKDVYGYLMTKFGTEIPNFFEKFALNLHIKYSCRNCVGGPFTGTFNFPILLLPAGDNFCDVLMNAIATANRQVIECAHEVNGIICRGIVRDTYNADFLNIPQILCFWCENVELETDIVIPEKLKLKVGPKEQQYLRTASSVCFTCYKDKKGKSYGDIYHVPVEGDVVDGAHTYVHLLTKKGFIEINNGVLSSVDPRTFGRVTPSSIHFYQIEQCMDYLPNVNLDQVEDRYQQSEE